MPLVPSWLFDDPSGVGYGFEDGAGVEPGVGTVGAGAVGTSQVETPVLIWT